MGQTKNTFCIHHPEHFNAEQTKNTFCIHHPEHFNAELKTVKIVEL
jgi:hypothetical protein